MFKERLWQTDILDVPSCRKQRSDILILKSGNATADAGNIEEKIRMLPGISDELVDVWFDGLDATLHSGNGITLTAMSDTAAHDSAKLLESDICGSTAVNPFQIAPKDENLVVP